MAPASQGEGKAPRPSPAVRQAAREMRKEPTRSEHLLWSALRDRRLDGYKFRRQHSVGPFILDFYCAEAGLGVEVDGAVHETQQIRDAGRQAALESFGIRFLRLPAALVEHDLEVALQLIQSALTDCPSPAAAGEGSGVRA
ncbi:MAG: endonuclease domain-containing protein [Dehalococcoidia bacterium]|nr:endonuclease domain-containing protein [Dehalococcoidia bacterium]